MGVWGSQGFTHSGSPSPGGTARSPRGLGLAAGYLKGLQSSLTANELKRKLARLGCTFEQGSKHTKVFFQGRVSLIPRHPAVEIKTGTLRGILKQLSIPKL